MSMIKGYKQEGAKQEILEIEKLVVALKTIQKKSSSWEMAIIRAQRWNEWNEERNKIRIIRVVYNLQEPFSKMRSIFLLSNTK